MIPKQQQLTCVIENKNDKPYIDKKKPVHKTYTSIYLLKM